MKNKALIALTLASISQISFSDCGKDFPTEHTPSSISSSQNISIPDGQLTAYVFRGQIYNSREALSKAQQNFFDTKLWVKNTDKNDWISGQVGTLEDAKRDAAKFCQISRGDVRSTSGTFELRAGDNLNLALDPVASRIYPGACQNSYFSIRFSNSAGKKFTLSCVGSGTYADMYANIKGILDVGCPNSLETGSVDPDVIRRTADDLKSIFNPIDKTLTGQIELKEQTVAMCLPGA